MSITINFSKNLVRIRKEKGISQKDLANLTNISPRMIAHYEKYVSHPSLEKIEIIAKSLNVSIFKLLNDDKSNNEGNEEELVFEKLSTKTLKQLKKILKLNPIDRSTIYKMVDVLLQKDEYKVSGTNK
jgi:transcriptional regulator with XRE-family HTH domain